MKIRACSYMTLEYYVRYKYAYVFFSIDYNLICKEKGWSDDF